MATASQIAAGLALQKYWHSSLYSQAARAIAVFSQRLSKPIAEWSAQDANHANLFQQASHALSKKDGVTDRYSTVPTTSIPVAIPPIRAPKPDDAESTAIDILDAVAASEHHNFGLFAETAQNPSSRPLFQVLVLDVLSQISAARVQEALEMTAMIKEGRLWESPTPVKWRCLQCGARFHAKKAFESCACCKAGRAFATCTAI